MCARWNQQWQWAARLSTGTVVDPEVSVPADTVTTDVLIVGGGVGGMAVAAAMSQNYSAVVVDPGGSTTSRSSGVAWWPNSTVHTLAMLKEATGADMADDDQLQEYIARAGDSFLYWEPRLDLVPWPDSTNPVPDYTDYSQKSGVRGHSYHSPTKYTDCGTGVACGQRLLDALKLLSSASTDTATVDRSASSLRSSTLQL